MSHGVKWTSCSSGAYEDSLEYSDACSVDVPAEQEHMYPHSSLALLLFHDL